MDVLLYHPLPARKQVYVACDHTFTLPQDASGTYFCSFTRERCGPHNCPLDRFKDHPDARPTVPGSAFIPYLYSPN